MSVITSPQHGAVVPSVSNSLKFNAHLPLAGFTPSGDLGPCAEKLGNPLLRADPVGVVADAVWARPVARAADGAKIQNNTFNSFIIVTACDSQFKSS